MNDTNVSGKFVLVKERELWKAWELLPREVRARLQETIHDYDPTAVCADYFRLLRKVSRARAIALILNHIAATERYHMERDDRAGVWGDGSPHLKARATIQRYGRREGREAA